MSILSEYEQIRKDLGEEVYQKIELFLLTRPDLYLSDVLYREKMRKIMNTIRRKDIKILLHHVIMKTR
jgi:hypothetical protein